MRNQKRWSKKSEMTEDLKREEGDRYKPLTMRTVIEVDDESFFEKAEVPKRIRKKHATSTSTVATKKTATSTSTAAGTKKKKAAKISIGNIKVKQNFTAGSGSGVCGLWCFNCCWNKEEEGSKDFHWQYKGEAEFYCRFR
ncbi:hypothetical protein C5167_042982 [Papaver somniferum]|uniref:Uncharacterized protein n=1 Tax=Papaver somniferum TaxID=3469 RepID=A0A4Y7L712_PAPSO|nr:hypothetical protein C5167_042982 [Papaver somniferum]